MTLTSAKFCKLMMLIKTCTLAGVHSNGYRPVVKHGNWKSPVNAGLKPGKSSINGRCSSNHHPAMMKKTLLKIEMTCSDSLFVELLSSDKTQFDRNIQMTHIFGMHYQKPYVYW